MSQRSVEDPSIWGVVGGNNRDVTRVASDAAQSLSSYTTTDSKARRILSNTNSHRKVSP